VQRLLGRWSGTWDWDEKFIWEYARTLNPIWITRYWETRRETWMGNVWCQLSTWKLLTTLRKCGMKRVGLLSEEIGSKPQQKVLSCESVGIVDLLKCDAQPTLYMSYLDICIKWESYYASCDPFETVRKGLVLGRTLRRSYWKGDVLFLFSLYFDRFCKAKPIKSLQGVGFPPMSNKCDVCIIWDMVVAAWVDQLPIMSGRWFCWEDLTEEIWLKYPRTSSYP